MVTKKMLISAKPELIAEADEVIKLINEKRITGDLSRSKIFSIALSEWVERQKKSFAILNDPGVQNGIEA